MFLIDIDFFYIQQELEILHQMLTSLVHSALQQLHQVNWDIASVMCRIVLFFM